MILATYLALGLLWALLDIRTDLRRGRYIWAWEPVQIIAALLCALSWAPFGIAVVIADRRAR